MKMHGFREGCVKPDMAKFILMIAVVLTLPGTGTFAGQSRAKLRRKYGVPISETFLVRPGITATATYGTGGRIIEYLISPQITDLENSRGRTLN